MVKKTFYVTLTFRVGKNVRGKFSVNVYGNSKADVQRYIRSHRASFIEARNLQDYAQQVQISSRIVENVNV
jgi:hypothetical protein